MGPFGIAGEQSAILDAARYVAASVGAGGGALAIYKALGHFMFPAARVKRRSAKSPIGAIQPDGTVTHPNGQLSCVYSVAGYDASLNSAELTERLAQVRAEWIAAMAIHNIELRLVCAKFKTAPPFAPMSPAPAFAPLTRRQFDALAPFFHTQMIVIATTRSKGRNARSDLDAADRDTQSGLYRFGVQRLLPETGCLEVLGAYLSTASRPNIRHASPDLAMLLNMDNFEADRVEGYVKFTTSAGRSVYGLVFSLARLGDYADTEFLPSLMSIGWECVVTQCLQPTSRAGTLFALSTKKRFASQHKSAAVDQTFDQSKDAQIKHEGSNPLTKFGFHLVVYTDTPDDFERIVAAVHERCANYTFHPMREGEYCRSAWQAGVPGQSMLTPTPRDLTARQVAALCPMALPWGGHARSEWLPHPVMYLRNAHGGVFGLNFHSTADDSQPSAHTKFIGVPGTGKTALINWAQIHLLANPRLLIVHVDHEKAAYPMVRALGAMGKYHDLSALGGTNPCQRSDTPENRRHLTRILTMIIGRGREVSASVQDWIDRAVSINFSSLTPLHLRNLRHLAAVAFPPEIDGISPEEQATRKILLAWIHGPAGRLLTADEDSIRIDQARMVAIDFGTLKEDALNAALMLSDVSNLIRNALVEERRPTVVCVDETKFYAGMPGMVSVLEGLSDTVRRLGGAVWTTWQRPKQIADAGMLSVIRAAPTTIAFAHPDTPADEYVEYLGFTQSESAVLNMDNPIAMRLKRPVLVKQGSKVAIVDSDLSSIGAGPLRLLSGLKGKDVLDRLDVEDSATAVSRFIGEAADVAA